MTDALLELLYAFAQGHEIEAILIQNDGYQESERCTRKQEERLRTLLDGTAASVFNDFLEEQKLLQLQEEEAHFRAGFKIGLELSR